MKSLTCNACGQTFTGPGRRRFCDDCLTEGRHRNGTYNRTDGYDLARSTVHLRLAVEAATAALELGRPAEALVELYRVEAPARTAARLAADVAAGRCGAVTDRVAHDGRVFERVRCYLKDGHYFAQRHEGDAAGVGVFQWDNPRPATATGEAA